MLKSDPGLLYYLTGRIVAARGGVPDDFRADPRVQHPDLTDLPAEFTIGQEFLVAWLRLLSDSVEPLHVFASRVMAFCAATFLIGLYFLVLARTRSVVWAALAVLSAFLVPANYRTIGFILVREDLALPLFALHLGLLAWAVVRERPAPFLGAGFAAAASLATWHATSFLVTVELLVACAALLGPWRSLFEVRGAWALVIIPAFAGLLVPALAESRLLLSPPATLASALLAAGLVTSRFELAVRGRLLAGLGGGAAHVLVALVSQLASGAPGSYGHVHQVLLAKLAFLGSLPADPRALTFDARLLWQGPFATLPPAALVAWLGWGAIGLALTTLVLTYRRRGLQGFESWLVLLLLGSFPLAWLFGRLVVLPGLLVSVAAVLLLAREARQHLALGLFTALLLIQALGFVRFVAGYESSWYSPPWRQREIASLVEWVEENVPVEEPIAADFMNSTAILAHAGNPICLQPKYETERSRRKAQEFLLTFFHGTPQELRELLRERFQVRYAVFDRYTLGYLSRYTAGLAATDPLPAGSAASVFLSQDEDVLRGAEGFELLYRSPEHIRAFGRPSDFFRLYRLE